MKKTYIIPVSRPIVLRDNILVSYSDQPATKDRNPQDVDDKMENAEGSWFGL